MECAVRAPGAPRRPFFIAQKFLDRPTSHGSGKYWRFRELVFCGAGQVAAPYTHHAGALFYAQCTVDQWSVRDLSKTT